MTVQDMHQASDVGESISWEINEMVRTRSIFCGSFSDDVLSMVTFFLANLL